MNPLYAIMESPHRWLILAGLAFGAGCVGAMAILAYDWPHGIARFWLYLGLLSTLFCLFQALLTWRRRVEADLSDGAEPAAGREHVDSPASR